MGRGALLMVVMALGCTGLDVVIPGRAGTLRSPSEAQLMQDALAKTQSDLQRLTALVETERGERQAAESRLATLERRQSEVSASLAVRLDKLQARLADLGRKLDETNLDISLIQGVLEQGEYRDSEQIQLLEAFSQRVDEVGKMIVSVEAGLATEREAVYARLAEVVVDLEAQGRAFREATAPLTHAVEEARSRQAELGAHQAELVVHQAELVSAMDALATRLTTRVDEQAVALEEILAALQVLAAQPAGPAPDHPPQADDQAPPAQESEP